MPVKFYSNAHVCFYNLFTLSNTMASRFKPFYELLDIELYRSWSFLYSIFYIIFGLSFNILILVKIQTSTLFLVIYLFFSILFFLLSGLMAKNVNKQFHVMNWYFFIVFFLTSVLAKGYMFTTQYKTGVFGLIEFLLIFLLSEATYVISLLFLTVRIQRISLRDNIGLKDDFFKNQRKDWNQNLSMLSNKEKISNILDQGSIVYTLFDYGFFNYALLWSCNIMEKIIDDLKEE